MAARIPIDLSDRVHAIDVEAYHAMIEAGVLGEDDDVELLEGVIVSMSPHGPAHAGVLARLTEILFEAIGKRYALRPQLPVTVRPRSEPEPDLAVVARAEGLRLDQHPTTALLVVEIANSSLAIDRGTKARVYATASIPEYWIVDVARQAIEVRTDPDSAEGVYRSLRTVGREATLVSATLPEISVAMAALFG